MTELVGKHVVVSGGGSGVGAEIARQFASAGAKVTIVGRRESPLAGIAGQTGALPLMCDVTDRASVDKALLKAREINGPVAVCVANAGAAASKPFKRMTADDLAAMMAVNVTGVFNLWQASLHDMSENNWGRMLAIASTAGLKGYEYVSGYCAAKHAVIGLTRSLSLELAKTGITVNSICPGFIETPMLQLSIENIVGETGMSREQAANALKAGNPMKRFIQVDEVAAAALWLAGEQTASITGQALSISGGEV
ncbi:3-hydroxyacyl-CoA dehydrogenase [Chromatiales bacterium (ex Bugula neritina AB1)]|nr:3-hydroxyacyl-CoA dehydrogenase [Chromatiales bacterium (ex Bugula neritina AB1)]